MIHVKQAFKLIYGTKRNKREWDSEAETKSSDTDSDAERDRW